MNPSQKPRSLCFTPRTPWGRYPQHRTGQNYLRASEDEQPDISPKEYLDRAGVPRSLSGQTTPERVEEIQDESIRLPSYSMPRLEAPDSTAAPEPACTPPAVTASGPFKREPTMEDLKKSGGHERAIEKPAKGLKELPPYVPSLDISPDYRGLKFRKNF